MDIDNNTEVPEPTSAAPTSEEERSIITTSTENNNNMTVDTPETTEEVKATSSPSKDNDAMDIEKNDVPTADTENKCPSQPPAAQEDTTMDDVNNTNDESNNNEQPQPPTAMETTTTTTPPKEEDLVGESSTKRVKQSVEETKPTPLQENNNNNIGNDKVKEELVAVKEKEQMKDVVVKNSNNSNDNLLEDKKLGEDLDSALDRLLESISVATLAHRKEEDNASKVSNNNDMNMNQIKKESNDAYGKLRDAAMKAYHSLVVYGSSLDLSAQSSDKENSNNVVQLSDVRRSRLLEMGRKLWMTIRNNPDLFNDMISQDSTKISVDDESGDFVTSFEGLKSKAIAGGYARAVAARLVFLNYIDTRCSVGSSTPQLHPVSDVASKATANLQELVFGLKLFSRAGRVILEHNKDARASFDSLSLAASCFDNISTMATNGNGEAADQLKDIIEEAFHAISMLSNSASLFGQSDEGGGDRIPRKNDGGKKVEPWQSLVLKNLERAESFVDAHCDVSTSTSKLATLSHYLPSLARLSLKHGSHFVKLGEHEKANKALQIVLNATNQCLSEVRKELDQESKSSKSRQMLQHLEKEMVVVSIESFFMLSASYQSSGEKKKALMCLDSVEKYMNEQNDRDNALQTNITNTLSSGKDFVFSEGAATSALEGSKSHFDKDKSDINNRLQTAHEDARSRQAAERATLTFSRIMVLHKSNPSSDDESMIDQKMKELVELALNFTDVSSSGFGSAQHTVTPSNSDKIFDLAIECIRRVHVRRTISTVSSDGDDMDNTYTDNYQLLLHKLPKTHFRRPFVMLDKLNAMLAVEFQVRESKLGDAKSIRRLDSEALQTAKEYLAIVKTFSRGNSSRDSADTTLFAASTQSLSTDLIEDTKQALCTAVSLYHSLEAHEMCAQWSDLLESVIQLSNKRSMSLEDDTDDLLGRIMTVKAHALSMSGNHTLGLQTAREAWTKVKNVDSMVTLFHCNLTNKMSSPNDNTMLEFDSALNELLSAANETTIDDVLAAFPRLSNSCVENEMTGGNSEVMLLGVQERWIDFLIGSKTFNQCLKDKDVSSSDISTEHSLFDILRAYLNNFEHVVSFKKDDSNFSMSSNFEALCRIIDGVLKLLVQVRDTKKMIPQKKTTGRRKKTKSVDDAAEKSDVVVLVWDDQTIKTLVGERSDCVWTAEQLWNIGNQLMAISLGDASVGGISSDRDTRGIAAEVFAASHDFCILSEEEEGSSLSKGYLDYDVKFDPTKSVLPKFDKSSNERLPCDISSEFSGQCLLISVAAAADYASECMFNNSSKGVGHVDNDVHILLSRSLHRLAHAQEEMLLNCEDESQLNDVNKMTSLLALRCLLGVGDDGQANNSLLNDGLAEALRKIHTDELASSSLDEDESTQTQFVILRNVKLLADAAEVKSMSQTSSALNRLCSSMLQQTNKFEVDIGGYTVSLGEIQRTIIKQATSIKDVIHIFNDVSSIVEKNQGSDGYSTSDLSWFATNSYNQAIQLKMIGDNEVATNLFTISLNLLPHCSKELQSYRAVITTAFTQANSSTSREAYSLYSPY